MLDGLTVKVNAPDILDRQLKNRARKGEYGYIVLSSATDPYLQFESEYQITRQMLEVILRHRFPVHMITKSDLILRDLELLTKIDETAILPDDLSSDPGRGAIISFSFSTIDQSISSVFEPGATSISDRLRALESCAKQGFLTGVSMMPLLPYISDTGTHLEEMFATFKELGAHYLMPATLTLFGEERADSKQMALRSVEKHYPHLLSKYHRLFGSSHEMPRYYRDAFSRKMEELSTLHDIRLKIRK